MAYNAAGLLESVALKLQNHPRYTRALRLDGLNRGIEQLVMFASEEYDVQEVLNPYSPGSTNEFAIEWPLPDNCLFVASVSFDGTPLKQITQKQFVTTRAEFSTKTEAPRMYYVRSNRYLNIYPRPSQQKTVQLYGLFKPDDLVNDEDAIPLNRVYTPALTSYSCWWCLQGQTGESERANWFLADYLRERAEAKFNMTQNTIHRIGRERYP